MALSNQLSHNEVGVVESLLAALLNDLHEAGNNLAVLVLQGEVPVLSEKDAVGLLQAHRDGDPYASFNLSVCGFRGVLVVSPSRRAVLLLHAPRQRDPARSTQPSAFSSTA